MASAQQDTQQKDHYKYHHVALVENVNATLHVLEQEYRYKYQSRAPLNVDATLHVIEQEYTSNSNEKITPKSNYELLLGECKSKNSAHTYALIELIIALCKSIFTYHFCGSTHLK